MLELEWEHCAFSDALTRPGTVLVAVGAVAVHMLLTELPAGGLGRGPTGICIHTWMSPVFSLKSEAHYYWDSDAFISTAPVTEHAADAVSSSAPGVP